MAQHRGEQGRGGLLIRGAGGGLWFIRDDATKPVKVRPAVAKKINSFLERHPQRQISGLSPDIQKLLSEQFELPDWWGIIVWWATRLPR
jgi:hypothetical protein